MGRGRINEKFFEPKEEKQREKIIIILHMKCGECGVLQTLRDLETDAFCWQCGNHMVEYVKSN